MAANEGWYSAWFAGGWFPSVWFAPGDESHLAPEEVYRPTDAGIAPNNIRFEPIREAEARTTQRCGASFGVRKIAGRAAASPTRVSGGGGVCAVRVSLGRANGLARIRRPSGAVGGARSIAASGSACLSGEAAVSRSGCKGGAGIFHAGGAAAANIQRLSGLFGVELIHPTGIQNPTDDELVAFFYMSRRNRLTNVLTGNIRLV